MSAGAVAAGLAALAVSAPPAHAPRAQGIVARVHLAPQPVQFGDVVTATVDVVVERRRIDPRDVAVRVVFLPYRPLAPATRARADAGGLTELRWTWRLDCLTTRCSVPARRLMLRLPPALVLFAPRGGTRERINLRWPELVVQSRLDLQAVVQAELPAFAAPWRADLSALPAVRYRIPPGPLEWTLVALATVLVLGGGGLVAAGLGVVPRVRRGRLPPLEHALAQVEQAREAAARRRALELLARELRVRGHDELALGARELAWSPRRPAADEAAALAERVRSVDGA
jgi:hypothetical protein